MDRHLHRPLHGVKQVLVYGVIDDNLVLLHEEVAKAYASDHKAIFALKTFGEARRFVAQGTNDPPGLDDEYYDESPGDDDPYSAAAFIEKWPECDWPPSAATIALGQLPEDLDEIGEEQEHFPGCPNLYIAPATEADLVETLQQRGYVVRRDDGLVSRI